MKRFIIAILAFVMMSGIALAELPIVSEKDVLPGYDTRYPITDIVGQRSDAFSVIFWRDMNKNGRPDRVEICGWNRKTGVELPIAIMMDSERWPAREDGLIDKVYTMISYIDKKTGLVATGLVRDRALEREYRGVTIWGEEVWIPTNYSNR